MSKLNDAFEEIRPSGELKEKTLAAVQAQGKAKRSKRLRIVAFSTAAVILLTVIFTGIVTSILKTGDEFKMTSFKNTAAVKKYIEKQTTYRKTLFETIGDILGVKKGTGGDDFASDAPVAESDSAASDYTADSGHSKTNNQVEGVAESDIVHTDGKYIYTLSYYSLTITALDTFTNVRELEFENFFPSEMFLLEEERILVILGRKYTGDALENYYYWYGNTECARTYNIDGLINGEAEHETVIRELTFPSAYRTAARMIGTNLYLVYNSYSYYKYDKNSRQITIPEYIDDGVLKELPAGDIYSYPGNGRSYGYTILAAADMMPDGSTEVKAYFGSAGTVYASKKAFYISYYRYKNNRDYNGSGLGILRFEINGASLKYKGGGKVDGFTVNQFGFDEYTYSDGKTYLRVATTTYGSFWDYTDNLITVFNDDMKVAGKLEGLGKTGERIYSVRFQAETAVVVTFRQTDPLYVIDLTDAKNPKKFSELEIPGVSDYMHYLKVNPDLVFAVGRRQDRFGSFLSGVKVSLFDISTTGAATEKAYYEPTVNGSTYSEATYNHKAILYFMPNNAETEVFGFSVNAYSYENVKVSETHYKYVYKSHCMFMYYTADAGGNLTQTEVMYTPDVIEIEYDYGYGSSYSYYYTDIIRRGVIANGYLYLIGNLNIEKYRLNDGFIPQTESKQTLKIADIRW